MSIIKKRSSFNDLFLDKPSPPRGPLDISGMTDTSFTIHWQPSENDGGSPIIEYIVEMRESSNKEYKKLGSTKAVDTVMSVQYLSKGKGYSFRITARNVIGISEPYLPEETVVAGSRLSKILERLVFRIRTANMWYTIFINKLHDLCYQYGHHSS